jgi:N-acetylmuramoyl-L-alanine amidase
MFAVENHLLTRNGTPVRQAPAKFHGGTIPVEWIVMHYTAGRSFQADLASLTAANPPGSAHVLIGQLGEIVQMLPFNVEAYHAGASSFAGVSGFNKRSVGIELSNPGALTRVNNADWKTWYGVQIQAAGAVAARHKKTPDVDNGWIPYSEVQLNLAAEVAKAIAREYGIKGVGVVGHEDINRVKVDPGPLFPMERFRRYVMGYDAEWRARP